MPSFFDLQRYAATGIASPDMTAFDKMRALAAFGGGTVQTLTDVPPLSFPSDGTPLISWSMKGNGSQSDTPTPDNPVMPEFVGVRTGNLLDYKYLYSDNIARVSEYFNYYKLLLKPNTDYTMLTNTPSSVSDPQETTLLIGNSNVMNTSSNGVYSQIAKTVTTDSEGKIYIAIRKKKGTSEGSIILVKESDFMNGTYTVMLNEGSTSLPYEPFGYKIPISCGGETTPVYLGQTRTVRRVRKLVLTGNETYQAYLYSGTNGVQIPYILETEYRRANGLCNIYPVSTVAGSTSCLWIGSGGSDRNLYFVSILSVMGLTDAADFKSWVTQKYAAGTPVTVWYVLKTPETAIVNEPLMKIGDYADELHSEDAGVTIPTVKGQNTLTVDTELQPSEVSITGNIKPTT